MKNTIDLTCKRCDGQPVVVELLHSDGVVVSLCAVCAKSKSKYPDITFTRDELEDLLECVEFKVSDHTGVVNKMTKEEELAGKIRRVLEVDYGR